MEYESSDSFVHGMGAVGAKLARVISNLPDVTAVLGLESMRWYVDDNNDGLIVTTGSPPVVEVVNNLGVFSAVNNTGIFSAALTADLLLSFESSSPAAKLAMDALNKMIDAIAGQNHIDPLFGFRFTSAVNRIYQENLAEYKSTGLYDFELAWSTALSDQTHTLVIRPFGIDDTETYVMPQTGIDAVVVTREEFVIDKAFNVDARASDHSVFLAGNDNNNRLLGSRYDDVLVGSGDEDLLCGGAGDDILYGSYYKDLSQVAVPSWVDQSAASAHKYIDQIVNLDKGDVTFLYGGTGNDTLVCSVDNDYCFIDVIATGNDDNVDTIVDFQPNLNFATDYLIFSAQQLGISYSSLSAWGWDFENIMLRSEWGSSSLFRQAPNLGSNDGDEEHFFKVDTIADYFGANPYLQDEDTEGINDYADKLPAWILAKDTGHLYFDYDGNRDYDDEYLVAKLNTSAVAEFDADNILLVSSFDMFTLNPEDVPALVNESPTGNVSFSAPGDLRWGVPHTANNTLQDANGLGAIGYRWQVSSDGVSNWKTISTGDTFALTASHIASYAGYRMRVMATYTDGEGFAESVTSAVSTVSIVATDSTAPAVSISSQATGDANGYLLSFTFSEAVTFDSSTITLTFDTEAAAQSYQRGTFTQVSPTEYTLAIQVAGSGNITVALPVAAAVDLVGNTIAATTQALSLNKSGNYTPGQAVIDLGEYGNLIAPVFVDGNWYYVWDMNGDGLHNGAANSTAKFNYDGSVANAAGTGWQTDYMTHDVLDSLFKFASDFTTLDTDNNTDNVYRFAELNGVKLALPTIGDGSDFVNSYGYRAGTEVDNNPAGEANATYDDLLAIWDAHNGSGSGEGIGSNGTPAGWQSDTYWSATPSAYGHASLYSGLGNVDLSYDYAIYAAVQVL